MIPVEEKGGLVVVVNKKYNKLKMILIHIYVLKIIK